MRRLASTSFLLLLALIAPGPGGFGARADRLERVARYLAAKGYEPRYEIGLEVLKACPTRADARPARRTPSAVNRVSEASS